MDCGHEITYRYIGTHHTWGITFECAGTYEPEFSKDFTNKDGDED